MNMISCMTLLLIAISVILVVGSITSSSIAAIATSAKKTELAQEDIGNDSLWFQLWMSEL